MTTSLQDGTWSTRSRSLTFHRDGRRRTQKTLALRHPRQNPLQKTRPPRRPYLHAERCAHERASRRRHTLHPGSRGRVRVSVNGSRTISPPVPSSLSAIHPARRSRLNRLSLPSDHLLAQRRGTRRNETQGLRLVAPTQHGGASTVTIQLKRVYEAPSKTDGTRILVDRLWPRGLTKRRPMSICG